MAKGFGGMPGGIPGMQGLMKQAQKMKEQIEKTQAEVESFETDAQSGGGMVKVRMNGKFRLLGIEIAKEVINADDQDMLQDLVQAAINEVVTKIQEHQKSEMGKVSGGMNLPGLF